MIGFFSIFFFKNPEDEDSKRGADTFCCLWLWMGRNFDYTRVLTTLRDVYIYIYIYNYIYIREVHGVRTCDRLKFKHG